MTTLSTSWIWAEDATTFGLEVDVNSAEMLWHDQLGCGCTDPAYVQPIAEFRERGAPGAFLLPDDISAELDVLLATVS